MEFFGKLFWNVFQSVVFGMTGMPRVAIILTHEIDHHPFQKVLKLLCSRLVHAIKLNGNNKKKFKKNNREKRIDFNAQSACWNAKVAINVKLSANTNRLIFDCYR